MARRRVVAFYSDLSGVEIGQEGVGVHFGLDGDSFEIDLGSRARSTARGAGAVRCRCASVALGAS